MTGWISLHRSIEDHWMFKEKRTFSKFEAWIDLLMMVNHKENKVLLGNELITVGRGQKITSIRQLCDRWSWSNNKVKNFLELLKSDGMLNVESDTKKTVLTIVKYDLYQNQNLEKRQQGDSEASRTHHDGDTNASRTHTNNNDNNVNKANNENNDSRQKQIDELFEMHSNLGYGAAGASAYAAFTKYLDEGFTTGMIERAYRIAANSNNKRQSYINGIFGKWKKDGLKTIEDVDNHENKRKRQAVSQLKSNNLDDITEEDIFGG